MSDERAGGGLVERLRLLKDAHAAQSNRAVVSRAARASNGWPVRRYGFGAAA
jgi:hypothetical protein